MLFMLCSHINREMSSKLMFGHLAEPLRDDP